MTSSEEPIKRVKRRLQKKGISKPNFVRSESWRYKRLDDRYRKPRGIDNKMRLKRKGWPSTPNVGYRSPRAVRGLHPSGLKEVLIRNVSELEDLNPETHAIRIAHTVGERKALEVSSKAFEKGLLILNPSKGLSAEAEVPAEEEVEADEDEST